MRLHLAGKAVAVNDGAVCMTEFTGMEFFSATEALDLVATVIVGTETQ